jgi:plastocyanin
VAALALLAPAAAGGAEIEAYDFGFENPLTEENTATIEAGETVTFSYPQGSSVHNVQFPDLGPASCTQTAGSVIGSVPPLPAVPLAQGWEGFCRFDTPQTYAFVCQAYPQMTGEVIVEEGSTDPPDPPDERGPTSPPPPAPELVEIAAPTLPPAASDLVLARTQRTALIRVSVKVAQAGSRLRIALRARRFALGRKGRKLVGVGRYSKLVSAGRQTVLVPLGGAAMRALEWRGRLALVVEVAVTPPLGEPFTATRRTRVVL